MLGAEHYRLLANGVMYLHFGITLFVVFGFFFILLGNWRGWHWVNHWWFRLVHLATMLFVVVQTALGMDCPLTTLESWLRSRAGEAEFSQGFIEHWVEFLLFYDAPTWVFNSVYVVFGLVVAGAWWYVPPRCGQQPPRAKPGNGTT